MPVLIWSNEIKKSQKIALCPENIKNKFYKTFAFSSSATWIGFPCACCISRCGGNIFNATKRGEVSTELTLVDCLWFSLVPRIYLVTYALSSKQSDWFFYGDLQHFKMYRIWPHIFNTCKTRAYIDLAFRKLEMPDVSFDDINKYSGIDTQTLFCTNLCVLYRCVLLLLLCVLPGEWDICNNKVIPSYYKDFKPQWWVYCGKPCQLYFKMLFLIFESSSEKLVWDCVQEFSCLSWLR